MCYCSASYCEHCVNGCDHKDECDCDGCKEGTVSITTMEIVNCEGKTYLRVVRGSRVFLCTIPKQRFSKMLDMAERFNVESLSLTLNLY